MLALTERHYESKRVAALLQGIRRREEGIAHRAVCALLMRAQDKRPIHNALQAEMLEREVSSLEA